MTHVLIPVKLLSQAKQRLSSVLTPQQRAGLVSSMLKDLLNSLSQVPAAQVSIISADDEVREIARELGVAYIQEQEVCGYNAAVALGLSTLDDTDCVAVLPVDIPLVKSEEIEQLIRPTLNNLATVRLVPSRDRMGTNGLFMSGKGLLAPAYGHDSFRGFQRAAQAAQIVSEVLELTSMALDIDTPEDLRTLAETNGESATMTFLHSISLISVVQERGIA